MIKNMLIMVSILAFLCYNILACILNTLALTFFFLIHTGVLISPLVDIYGSRIAALAGSLIYVIAILLSAMMPKIWCLVITYGLVAGINMELLPI